MLDIGIKHGEHPPQVELWAKLVPQLRREGLVFGRGLALACKELVIVRVKIIRVGADEPVIRAEEVRKPGGRILALHARIDARFVGALWEVALNRDRAVGCDDDSLVPVDFKCRADHFAVIERDKTIKPLVIAADMRDRLPQPLGQRSALAKAVGVEQVYRAADRLDLLDDLRDERNMSLILITHDLGVAEGRADRIGVMYAGRLMELTSAKEKASALATDIVQAFATLRPLDPTYTAAYLIWREPFMVAGHGTFIKDMVKR